MKKYIFKILITFCTFNLNAQIPINKIVNIESHTALAESAGTYVKDINGTFNPYIGKWSYSNGSEKIIFTIKKITQQFMQECFCYGDFLVADYKYINSNGIIVSDTSTITNESTSIMDYKMFCAGLLYGKLDFSFYDIVFSKHADILFTPVSGNTNQMIYHLKNRAQTVVEGQPFESADFSIPNDITVTKE